MKTEHIGV